VTTFEPGARLVFTQGFVRSPLSAAFLATSPAATITDGLEVLVQDVMAAITTDPFFSSKVSSSRETVTRWSWSSAPAPARICRRSS